MCKLKKGCPCSCGCHYDCINIMGYGDDDKLTSEERDLFERFITIFKNVGGFLYKEGDVYDCVEGIKILKEIENYCDEN